MGTMVDRVGVCFRVVLCPTVLFFYNDGSDCISRCLIFNPFCRGGGGGGGGCEILWIEQEKKITRLQTWKVVTRKRKKVYHYQYTDSANSQIQEKASTGPAAAKRERPPLGQQRNTAEIAQNLTHYNQHKAPLYPSLQELGREGEREEWNSSPPKALRRSQLIETRTSLQEHEI